MCVYAPPLGPVADPLSLKRQLSWCASPVRDSVAAATTPNGQEETHVTLPSPPLHTSPRVSVCAM